MHEKRSDVSNQAVAVLLVLTILVTVVGTWLVLDALTGTATASPSEEGQQPSEAQISLALMESPIDNEGATIGLTLATPP